MAPSFSSGLGACDEWTAYHGRFSERNVRMVHLSDLLRTEILLATKGREAHLVMDLSPASSQIERNVFAAWYSIVLEWCNVN